MVGAGTEGTGVDKPPGVCCPNIGVRTGTCGGEVATGLVLDIGVATGGDSVGVEGRGMVGVGTSLAWLVGESDGLPGAGDGAAGQRPQVAAQ